MQIQLAFGKSSVEPTLILLPAFSKQKTAKSKDKVLVNSFWPKDLQSSFKNVVGSQDYKGEKGDTFSFIAEDGVRVLVLGLGEKTKVNAETLRREIAKIYRAVSMKTQSMLICLDSMNVLKGVDKTAGVLAEALQLAAYNFDRYKSVKKEAKLTKVIFAAKDGKAKVKVQKELDRVQNITESINVARDFVNDPPNVLNSEVYSKQIQDDVKKNLKGVKVKVLGKAALKKEKMGLFLSVNAASAFEPQLVHLTYTPKRATKKTKHIALVGKGLTFDTGGLSLKPSTAMVNMKFDMAGSATVYGAFRAAVLNNANCKITCILGITDNAVSGLATQPDAIVTARNGKTVEILNTDAEGRLVLADCLDYACDLKPDQLINAATLTGAILVGLGSEVCGLFSNSSKLAKGLLDSAKKTDEYMWQMPMIDEYRNDMKSPIADLKNIGGSRFAGSAKAGCFLEEFVQEGVDWAHLDIAGIGDSQSHLPYCPAKGASGSIIRTLTDHLTSTK